MSDLINNSSGLFTAAGTWSLVDPTSFLNSETNSTNTTTAFVSSSAFTPGGITIDGIAVKVSTRSAAPSGTFEVRLFNNTGGVAEPGTTVIINVSDIPEVMATRNAGWVFMKFSAPVLLAALDSYSVQVRSSVNAQVTVYRDATAANWSRILRTTTNQAPVAGDNMYVGGEYISAASNNSFTVTMDNTTTDTFGVMQISAKGILNWQNNAATNYYLKLSGNLTIYTDGIYRQGRVSAPIPSTSTAKLEFLIAVNVAFGIETRGGYTFRTGGNPLTNISALLAADAAAAATALTTNISTGWLSGDLIALASTTRTRTESEVKALTANAVGTALTISALTNAHSGTAPTRAELLNLTRNVQIFGTSTALQTYINLNDGTVEMDSTEMFFMGSVTGNKRGVDLSITTGTATINKCSFRDFVVASSIGLQIDSLTTGSLTITNNVFYNTITSAINVSALTGTSYTINNCFSIFSGTTAFNLADLGGTITNLTASGATTGVTFSEIMTAAAGTLSGFTTHSCSGNGINFSNTTGFSNNPQTLISNFTTWRNNTAGFVMSNTFNLELNTAQLFGNNTANLNFSGVQPNNNRFVAFVSNSDIPFATAIGMTINSDNQDNYIDSSFFGAILPHSTADISVAASNLYVNLVFRNTFFGSTTRIINTNTNLVSGSSIGMQKINSIVNNNITYRKSGTISLDSTIFRLASPSQRLTPASAVLKMKSSSALAAINNTKSCYVEVWVRTSVAGDGTAYNGNFPRLILKANPANGITNDTVLATATIASSGAFERLSAITPVATDNTAFQFCVDCDGTLGWINIDDWRIEPRT